MTNPPGYQRAWIAANPEKWRSYQAKYRAKKGREYWRLAVEKWRKSNPDRARELWRIYRSNRRAQTKGNIVLEQIANWQTRICGICDKPIEGNYHVDHIVPLSKGGKHSLENLQLAHPFCNISKGNRLTTKP